MKDIEGEAGVASVDLAEIVKGLSDKMRFNIVSARETFDGEFLTRAFMHMKEQNALRSRGLSKGHSHYRDRLTPLGLAVRAHLIEQQEPR